MSGILEDEQGSSPDEGAEKSESAEGMQTWSRDATGPARSRLETRLQLWEGRGWWGASEDL